MQRLSMLLTGALALTALASLRPAPAAAQQGFALKGSAVFNSSTAHEEGTSLRLSDAAGFDVGAEYVLPGGLGLSLEGYTAGSPSSFDVSQGSLVMLAEANYFLHFPFLPVSPYAGLHVGLGTYDLGDVKDGVRPHVDFGDRGWQVGVRFQPTSLLGVDAKYRRVSGSLSDSQDSSFERNQVLLGVTLF